MSEIIEHFRKFLNNPDSFTEEEIASIVSPVEIEINEESYRHLIEDLNAVNEELRNEGREEWNFSDMIMSDMFLIYHQPTSSFEGINLIVNPPHNPAVTTVTIYRWLHDRLTGLLAHFEGSTMSEAIVRVHVIAILIRNPAQVVEEETDFTTELMDDDHKMFG